MRQLQIRTQSRRQVYGITVGRGVLSLAGNVARKCFGKRATRAAIISNQKVFSLYGSVVRNSLAGSDFTVVHWLMRDGERHKSLTSAEAAVRFLMDNELGRNDGVIALGGGVVGDLAGFAASIYLRGIPFIQIPTTLLAQVDASVGGKTGVNLPAGKNLVGSFHQPSAVIVDLETLTTLPSRELVAGWCETLKQGAVGGRKLFDQTTGYLNRFDSRKLSVSAELEKLIAAHCAFKASVVAADEREAVNRRDSRSRRILNFGHTIAHALETVTNYRRFRHGEAVGHGMLVAAELSKNLGLLQQSELELLAAAVGLCGPLPPAHDLDESAIMNALARDKKRTAGHIQWVLLERLGRARIVDGKEISSRLVRKSLRAALQK